MSSERPTRAWRRASDEAPRPPKAGLPRQATPRWLARLLQATVLPFMLLDLTMQKLIQWLNPPPYELKGACKQRGNCCHFILMEWPPVLEKWPLFGRFWMWWYTDVHGFYTRGFELENDQDERVAKVMSCRHLQPDGRCGNYALRPAICRQWPRIEYTSGPHILKGCGYFITPRDEAPDED